MKYGILISSSDPETVWNALRFANLLLEEEHDVSIFLNGPAVDLAGLDCPAYPVRLLAKTFALSEGVLRA